MKVYFLYPKNYNKWINEYPNYAQGTSWGVIVIAQNKKKARKVASESSGKAWLNGKTTICEEINPEEYDVACSLLDHPPWGTSKV